MWTQKTIEAAFRVYDVYVANFRKYKAEGDRYYDNSDWCLAKHAYDKAMVWYNHAELVYKALKEQLTKN